MIKGVILVLSLAALATSVSYGQFIVNRNLCKDQNLKSCEFQPLNADLSDDELQCAKDYEQANVCFYHYSQCMAKDDAALSDTLPLVCWQCYMQVPSESQLYGSFKQCLQKSSSELTLVLSLIAMLILILA